MPLVQCSCVHVCRSRVPPLEKSVCVKVAGTLKTDANSMPMLFCSEIMGMCNALGTERGVHLSLICSSEA